MNDSATEPSTMPKRQAAFREDFRGRIARFYSGPLHVLMIFGIGWLILGFGSAQYQGGDVAQPNYAPQP